MTERYAATPAEPLTQPGQVRDLLDSIRRAGVFALDTEFISEGSYSPQLALVQIATPERIELIDPLAAPHTDDGRALDLPIWEAVADPTISTVVHAHDQESRFCIERAGRPPQNLFDVQLAAGFCGHRFPIGYGALIDAELGISASASQSRTDWTRRPLSRSQLQYAADDVRWLLPLHDALRAQLAGDERARWLGEELQLRITSLDAEAAAETPRWRKLGGVRRLNRRSLAALRELHAWRDAAARELNRPLKRIARDDALVAVAAMLPATLDDLLRVRGAETLPHRHRRPMLAAVQRALKLPPDELPQRQTASAPPPRTLTSFVDALLDALCAERRIDSKLVAASADVREVVEWARAPRGQKRGAAPRLMQSWRREFAGEAILAALDGRISLRIADHRAEQPLVAESV